MKYYFISYAFNSCYGSCTMHNATTILDPIEFQRSIYGWREGTYSVMSWQEITKEQFEAHATIDEKKAKKVIK